MFTVIRVEVSTHRSAAHTAVSKRVDVEAVFTWGTIKDGSFDENGATGLLCEGKSTASVVLLLGILKRALGVDSLVRARVGTSFNKVAIVADSGLSLGSVVSRLGSVVSGLLNMVLRLGSVVSGLGSVVFRLGSVVFRLGSVVFRLGRVVFRLGRVVFRLGSVVFRLGSVVFRLRIVVSGLGTVILRLGIVVSGLGTVVLLRLIVVLLRSILII